MVQIKTETQTKVYCKIKTKTNKRDGYRQQIVRQRQKLISIIDYDVCILENLQPFWRYSTSKSGLTLKSGYRVLHSNYGRIYSHFGDIQRQRMA